MESKRKMLYVGGLDPSVDEATLHAAFIPFGNIKEVNIPKDFSTNSHRGFGFVDYEDDEDAADAIDNMDGAELYGKVLRVNIAKPMTKIQPGKALWSADDWIQNNLAEEQKKQMEEDRAAEATEGFSTI